MTGSLLVIVFILASVMLRPAAMGQSLTPVGIVLCLIALGLELARKAVRGHAMVVSKHNLTVFACTALLWAYLWAHSLLMNPISVEAVMKSAITHLIVVFAAALLLSDQTTNRNFFRGLLILLFAGVVSYIITMVLSTMVTLDSLFLFQLPVEGYEMGGNTYFPFTILYGFMNVGTTSLPRLAGVFREAGILQAFLVWGILSSGSLGLNQWWFRAVLILGVLVTFSTAGLAILACSYVLYVVLAQRNKRVLLRLFTGLLLMAGGLVLSFYAPFIGLTSKNLTHSASVETRAHATVTGIKLLLERPLGIGLYNTNEKDSGINLLAISHQIGVVGLVLVLCCFFLPAITSANWLMYITTVTPIFLTLMVSQPLLDAPLVYFLFMLSHSPSETKQTAPSRTVSLFVA